MSGNCIHMNLGDVCSFSRGLTFAKGDVTAVSSKRVLRSNNIDLETFSLNVDDIVCLKDDFVIPEDKMLHKGDIFICMSNGSTHHLGKVAFIDSDIDCAFGGFMGAIRPNTAKVTPKYIYYVCRSSEYKRFLTSIFNGVNINNLKWTDLSNLRIPVLPLVEQERIVSELDLLSGIIDKQKAQLKELDNLAQSIFYDMFGDPVENEKGWEVRTLENIVSANCTISYGIVQPGDDVENGVPVVRPIDLTHNIVKRNGLKRISKSISDKYKRTILKGDEILFCVRGTTGVISYASSELQGCNVTRGIAPLSFGESVNRHYIFYYLNTKYMQDIVAENTRGIALRQINMKDVRVLPILLPSLPLQQQFAEKMENIEKQKTAIIRSIAETQQLFDSRMAYWFD